MSVLYLKNLDGLRFLAAFMVILHHCSLFKHHLSASLSNVFKPYLDFAVAHGVYLFFALSGFLISYLLFAEREATQTISVKRFYIRRLLRIWPLYFAVGILGILAAPYLLQLIGVVASETGVWKENLTFLCLFAVNIQLVFFEYNRNIVEILWSIGVEEQFYLLWAPLVKQFHQVIVGVFWVTIVLGAATPFVFDYLKIAYGYDFFRPFYFFTTSAFPLFGFGALASYYYFHRERYKRAFDILLQPSVQAVVLGATLLLIVFTHELSDYTKQHFLTLLDGLLFSYLMIAAVSERSILNLEHNILRQLGKISYGLYLFHTFIAQLVLRAMVKFVPNSFLAYDVLYPLVVTFATVVVSYVSYHYFEMYFLKLKKKFSVVQTRT